MSDSPPGAYFQLMRPAVAAITLTYCHRSADQEPCKLPQTIPANVSGGGSWERLTAFEQNPLDAGVVNLVFVDRGAKRAILSFKGGCLEHEYKRCRADMCFLVREQSFGFASSFAFGSNRANNCSGFSQAQLDYVPQARNLTKSLQEHLGPDYAILLVGHSMGGLLSMLMAMEQPETLQAFTAAPSPFHKAALDTTQLTEVAKRDLPGKENRVAIGDPFDLVPNTAMVPLAREGALSCVYDDWDAVEPEPCIAKDVKKTFKDRQLSIFELPLVAPCKKAAHDWDRYGKLTLMRQSGSDSPRWLPNCSTSFSTMTPGLVDTASL